MKEEGHLVIRKIELERSDPIFLERMLTLQSLPISRGTVTFYDNSRRQMDADKTNGVKAYSILRFMHYYNGYCSIYWEHAEQGYKTQKYLDNTRNLDPKTIWRDLLLIGGKRTIGVHMKVFRVHVAMYPDVNFDI